MDWVLCLDLVHPFALAFLSAPLTAFERAQYVAPCAWHIFLLTRILSLLLRILRRGLQHSMEIPATKFRITWIAQSPSLLMLPTILSQRNSTHRFATLPTHYRHNATVGWHFRCRVEQGPTTMVFQVILLHHFKRTLRCAGHGSSGCWVHGLYYEMREHARLHTPMLVLSQYYRCPVDRDTHTKLTS